MSTNNMFSCRNKKKYRYFLVEKSVVSEAIECINVILFMFQKHDSSHYLLCLYCLRTFLVKFVSQGWGQTQTYYGHLLKHQSKSTTKKCVICRLTFFNSQDVKLHRKSHHVAHHKGVLGRIIQDTRVIQINTLNFG